MKVMMICQLWWPSFVSPWAVITYSRDMFHGSWDWTIIKALADLCCQPVCELLQTHVVRRPGLSPTRDTELAAMIYDLWNQATNIRAVRVMINWFISNDISYWKSYRTVMIKLDVVLIIIRLYCLIHCAIVTLTGCWLLFNIER